MKAPCRCTVGSVATGRCNVMTSSKDQVCRGCRSCAASPGRKLAKVTVDNADLSRVRGKIGPAIVVFLRGRIKTGRRTFFINDLQGFVATATLGNVAPASPDRILRNLRQRGLVDYELLDRSSAKYRVKAVSA